MFSLRDANQDDHGDIRQLIRAVRINPTRLDWRRFVVAVDGSDRLIGCGQVKPHRDGSRELSSVAVADEWRGEGVARAIIGELMERHKPPLWLTCRSSLVPMYENLGFRQVGESEEQPPFLRRVGRLAEVFQMFSASGEYLAVMTWEGNSSSRGP